MHFHIDLGRDLHILTTMNIKFNAALGQTKIILNWTETRQFLSSNVAVENIKTSIRKIISPAKKKSSKKH